MLDAELERLRQQGNFAVRPNWRLGVLDAQVAGDVRRLDVVRGYDWRSCRASPIRFGATLRPALFFAGRERIMVLAQYAWPADPAPGWTTWKES